jgi:hypothetical protein
MPEELASQTRVPCRGGVPPIKGRELQRILQLVPEWKAVDRRGANHPRSLLTSNNGWPHRRRCERDERTLKSQASLHGRRPAPRRSINWYHRTQKDPYP